MKKGDISTGLFMIFVLCDLVAIASNVMAIIWDNWVTFDAMLNVYVTASCNASFTYMSLLHVRPNVHQCHSTQTDYTTSGAAMPSTFVQLKNSANISLTVTMGTERSPFISSGEISGLHKILSLLCEFRGPTFSGLVIYQQMALMATFPLLTCALATSWIHRLSKSNKPLVISVVTTWLSLFSLTGFMFLTRIHGLPDIQGELRSVLDLPESLQCATHALGTFTPIPQMSFLATCLAFSSIFVMGNLNVYVTFRSVKTEDTEAVIPVLV
jgi:hypothetical protein